MPKYHKKPKGVDAHQHLGDWTGAEPWVQELIAAGRIVPGPPAALLLVPGALPITIALTDWLVLEVDAVLLLLSDAVFQASYDQQGGGPPTITGDVEP